MKMDLFSIFSHTFSGKASYPVAVHIAKLHLSHVLIRRLKPRCPFAKLISPKDRVNLALLLKVKGLPCKCKRHKVSPPPAPPMSAEGSIRLEPLAAAKVRYGCFAPASLDDDADWVDDDAQMIDGSAPTVGN